MRDFMIELARKFAVVLLVMVGVTAAIGLAAWYFTAGPCTAPNGVTYQCR